MDTAVLAVGLIVFVLSLVATVRGRRQRRTTQKSPEIRHVRAQETIMLRHTPAQVWALIGPAEHASVLSANIVRGFTVPGTLTGVGQQQCFIDLHGNTCIIEVVEYEEGRRAVTRAISPRPAVPVRSLHTVELLDAGCLLSIGIECDAPTATNWTPDMERT